MPGKTVSPRLKEIEDNFIKNGGSFKEFRIGELFEVTGTKSIDAGKLTFSDHGINFIGRTGEFNGIQGKIEKLDFAPNPANTITVTVIGYKYVKYQEEPYYCSQNINKLTPKFELNHLRALWLMSGISKFVGQYNGQYSGYKLEQLKNAVLYVPIYTDNRIAFDYMENFIRELEMERIRELEMERIRELDAYLKATGLNNTELTDEEKDCLEKFEKREVCLKEFRIGELFYKLDLKCRKTNFDKKKDISVVKTDEFCLPLLSAKSSNNGIMCYGRLEDWDAADMSVDILSNGDAGNVFPQPQKTGVFSDAYLIKGIEKKFHNERIITYVSQALRKSIKRKYSYNRKAIWNRVKDDFVSLPVCDNRIAFDTMEIFIRALEKLCIRSVVEWKDKIIETTKRIVDANASSDA